ncbi:SH3 domain-containing protein [Sediminihabitans luteus]|nr:SH3 domain-containing protein [Sediminihabitans luteus]
MPSPSDAPSPSVTVPPIAVTSALANVREAPECDATALVKLEAGAPVQIAGDPRSGWYPVEISGLEGWVAGSVLDGPGIPEIAQLCGDATSAVETSEQANVRVAPSCSAKVVTRLAANTSVELTGDPQSGWYPVKAGDLEGWIAGSLLSGPEVPQIGQLCGSTIADQLSSTAATEPIGSVRIYGPEGGGNYGQGFADGECSNWHVRVVNQSNTAIAGFTFTSVEAEYVNGYSDASTQVTAQAPAPVQVDAYVAPGTEQDVRFRACTSTPYPGSGFDLGVTPSNTIIYHWVTGRDGSSNFGW